GGERTGGAVATGGATESAGRRAFRARGQVPSPCGARAHGPVAPGPVGRRRGLASAGGPAAAVAPFAAVLLRAARGNAGRDRPADFRADPARARVRWN